jgi:hypothetical protein
VDGVAALARGEEDQGVVMVAGDASGIEVIDAGEGDEAGLVIGLEAGRLGAVKFEGEAGEIGVPFPGEENAVGLGGGMEGRGAMRQGEGDEMAVLAGDDGGAREIDAWMGEGGGLALADDPEHGLVMGIAGGGEAGDGGTGAVGEGEWAAGEGVDRLDGVSVAIDELADAAVGGIDLAFATEGEAEPVGARRERGAKDAAEFGLLEVEPVFLEEEGLLLGVAMAAEATGLAHLAGAGIAGLFPAVGGGASGA